MAHFRRLREMGEDKPESLRERAGRDEGIRRLCSVLYDIVENLWWVPLAKERPPLPNDRAVIQARHDYEKRYSEIVTEIARINKFMTLFSRLKEWIDDNPKIILSEAEKDLELKKICLDLWNAAFNVKLYFSNAKNRIILSVNSDFISNLRDYEERYECTLDELYSNSSELFISHIIALENNTYYVNELTKKKLEWKWDEADYKGEDKQESLDRTINSLKGIGELLINNEEYISFDTKFLFKIFKSMRRLYSCDKLSEVIEYIYCEQENYYIENIEKIYEKIGGTKNLKSISDQIEILIKDNLIYKDATLEGLAIQSIYKFLEESVEHWNDLKENYAHSSPHFGIREQSAEGSCL